MAFNPEREITQSWTRRPKTTHKGQVGKVLVIGGSPEYAGAPALAAIAALRSGAGYVTLAAPRKTVEACHSLFPEIVGVPLSGKRLSPSHASKLLELASYHSVVLVGNGTGKKEMGALKKIVSLLIARKTRLVLDAGAFDLLARSNIELNNCILLPHVGEFKRWTEMDVRDFPFSSRVELLKKIIGERKVVINLKDWKSVIVSCHFSYINQTGNAGMSKAGSGDVLAGLTAGFWAQGMGAFSATACAAWLNGKMGDNLKSQKWYGYIARDLMEELGRWKKRKTKK